MTEQIPGSADRIGPLLAVADGERAVLWQRIFGTDRLPLRDGMPVFTHVLGSDQKVLAYLVDLKALTQAQHDGLMHWLSGRSDVSADRLARVLAEVGLPIIGREMTITGTYRDRDAPGGQATHSVHIPRADPPLINLDWGVTL